MSLRIQVDSYDYQKAIDEVEKIIDEAEQFKKKVSIVEIVDKIIDTII